MISPLWTYSGEKRGRGGGGGGGGGGGVGGGGGRDITILSLQCM